MDTPKMSSSPSDKEIDKIAAYMANVTDRILKAMDSETSQSNNGLGDVDKIEEKLNLEKIERKVLLENEFNAKSKRITNKWKRY